MMTKAERHAKAAERYEKDGGHVTLTECDVCGYLEWVSTAPKEPKGFTVVLLDSDCPRCSEVLQRAPEVATWVFAVIAKNQEDAAPNVEFSGRDAASSRRVHWNERLAINVLQEKIDHDH